MASPIIEDVQWPELTVTQTFEIIGIPAAMTLFFITILYFLPPFGVDLKDEKQKPNEKSSLLQKSDTAVLLEAGQQSEEVNYETEWTQTFDLAFTIFMAGVYVTLFVCTWLFDPDLFHNKIFWIYQLPKPAIMVGVSVCMGLICNYFIQTDENGYIVGKSKARTHYKDIFIGGRGQSCCGRELLKPWFKVNYTRKIQHFAAYLIPLVIAAPESCNCKGVVAMAWGQTVTLTCFWILIKPVRERLSCVMLQFNSMDRPEDRPHTLKWIVGGNIIPGMILILIFRYMFSFTQQSELTLIFVFVTGLGDGFAEPVGVYTGRHKYKARSCTSSRAYVRSYEGSACVWLSGHIFTSMMWYGFKNSTQFWTCFWLMGPIMAVAEATSPHTMDTPALMTCGGLIIYGCIQFL